MFFVILCALTLLFVLCFSVFSRMQITIKRACVIVLGDVGRSPRMQYHSLSLAREGYMVDLIGYGGSRPHENLSKNKNINVHHMLKPPEAVLKNLPGVLRYVVKVIWQSIFLFTKLIRCPTPSHILIQTVPAIPTMLVSKVVSVLWGATLVFDWHNYSYSILALTLSPSHPLVRFVKCYEQAIGRLSHFNICVTNALKKHLLEEWGIHSSTMHDRPPDIFKSIDIYNKHAFYEKLCLEYLVFKNSSNDENCLTEIKHDENVCYRENRPAIIVSSTSWTEDEDFSILLNALKEYDNTTDQLPEIICVITGKGPLKSFYTKQINCLNLKKVKFCLPWLPAEDYPKMLASADIGISLHTSSSGLDLPMKVVDMFGCGLPVCAMEFNCIDELVKDGENGNTFKTENQLCSLLKKLLDKKCNNLSIFRENIRSFQKLRWDDEWKKHVLPIFDSR